MSLDGRKPGRGPGCSHGRQPARDRAWAGTRGLKGIILTLIACMMAGWTFGHAEDHSTRRYCKEGMSIKGRGPQRYSGDKRVKGKHHDTKWKYTKNVNGNTPIRRMFTLA
eukprot:8191851-Heterocapsa_arctica.AAC.1